MRLNTHHTHPSHLVAADQRLAKIETPLILRAWAQSLRNHPDKDYVQYLLNGIEQWYQTWVPDRRVPDRNPRKQYIPLGRPKHAISQAEPRSDMRTTWPRKVQLGPYWARSRKKSLRKYTSTGSVQSQRNTPTHHQSQRE